MSDYILKIDGRRLCDLSIDQRARLSRLDRLRGIEFIPLFVTPAVDESGDICHHGVTFDERCAACEGSN